MFWVFIGHNTRVEFFHADDVNSIICKQTSDSWEYWESQSILTFYSFSFELPCFKSLMSP